MPAVDYDALAAQHGGAATPASTGISEAAKLVDYDALAAAHGGTATPPPDFHTEVKASDAPDWMQRAANSTEDFATDLLTGFAKGGASTAVNLGELALNAPLLGRVLTAVNRKLFDLTPEQQHAAFTAARENVKPKGTVQAIGKGTEQIAELVAPSKLLTEAGMKAAATVAPRLTQSLGPILARALPRAAVEATGAAGMAKAQGGSATTGAVLGAVAPMASEMVSGIPASLKESAEKKVVQALGPTKERFKAIANRLAPEILKRGLGGSRASLQQKAAETLDAVGDQIDAALAVHGPRTISTQAVSTALETAKDAFRTTNAAGAVVEFEPRAIRQLSGLQKVIADLGPDATVDQLTAVRRAWDKVVAQAGGYAQRAGGAIGVPLKDQSEAFAKREGATAIRKLLADEVPDLAAINKEYAFWKNVDDVLTQTLQRTQPQGPGLGKQVAEVAGAAAGASHGIGVAYASGKVAKMADAVLKSPRWQFVSARLRNNLADAMMSGSAQRVGAVLGQIVAVQGSKAPATVASP